MIQIKVEKVTDRGVQMFKILEIECLPEMKLPPEYLKDHYSSDKNWAPYVLGHVDGDILMGNFDPGYDNQGRNVNYRRTIFQIGKSYTQNDFKRILRHIHQSGKRLGEINERLRKENAHWYGERTYTF